MAFKISANGAAGLDSAELKSLARHTSQATPSRVLIDAALTIEGDLQTDREVEVDGRITGNVSCTRLTVGKDATVTGNIKADEVVVRGKVTGTIRATRLILQGSAHVQGDVFHDRIVIDDGAQFTGTSNPKPIGNVSISARLN